jgi:hypothetical protein
MKLHRRCRTCDRVARATAVRFAACPYCGAEYGRLELGMDAPLPEPTPDYALDVSVVTRKVAQRGPTV